MVVATSDLERAIVAMTLAPYEDPDVDQSIFVGVTKSKIRDTYAGLRQRAGIE